ncbi:MAG TPA: redox-regulated ATPase YchF [Caldilineae bacterium]|nr:redox-regulated ATPase YchF [Caldilineae bacterium]
MQIGIIGLPQSGKTTIFRALTGGRAERSTFAPGGLQVQTAIVNVPDPRLDALGERFQPRRTVHAQIQYTDIGGLERGLGEAGGLSGPLLNQIAQNDALMVVLRAFPSAIVPHPEGSIDPARDLAIIQDELMLSDMALIERRLQRLRERMSKGGTPAEREANAREMALLERLMAVLEAGRPLRDEPLSPDEERMLRGYGFLTQKPLLIIVNQGDDPADDLPMPKAPEGERITMLALRGQLEMELAQMSPEEAAEFLAEFGIEELGLYRVVRASYEVLGLITFFTMNEEEIRAWALRRGGTALEAAATIHTDLARGFIRAEVIEYDRLLEAGSLAEARRRGWLRLEGKDYIVQDGEMLYIRFNV